jgi:phosphoglycolate phosphatase
MMPLMEHYFPTIRFTCVLGQREGIPVKPNPQIVFDIMKIAEVAAEETLYVGDTDVDMDTAHGAGLKAVGALWGYRDRQELAEHHAEYIIAKPVELVELTVNN